MLFRSGAGQAGCRRGRNPDATVAGRDGLVAGWYCSKLTSVASPFSASNRNVGRRAPETHSDHAPRRLATRCSFSTDSRALSTNPGSILFLDWRGDPASRRSMSDAIASVEIGSALGVRQSETHEGRAILAPIPAPRLSAVSRIRPSSLRLILSQNRSVRMAQG